MMEKSKEDYLRTIYSIYEHQEDKSLGIKSVDIAGKLQISKPSVSEMIKNLAKEGQIKVKPYSKIFFTKKGLNEAMRVMHNHRVIEVFLKKILKYSMGTDHEKSRIHEEAHRLEHAFSDDSIKKLDEFLKNPKESPFGYPIPHKRSIKNE